MKYKLLALLQMITLGAMAQSSTKNFVLSRTFKNTGAPANNVSQVQIQVNYLDGLGRPVQTVNVAQSPTGKDIVVPTEYDGFGRQVKNYLPYTVANGNGGFQNNATTAQRAFYFTNNSAGLEGPNADLDRAYNESTLENAPSGRSLKVRAPGVKSTDGQTYYGTNSATDVKLYTYSAGSVATSQSYPAGSLFKRRTVDEEGKEVTEFTDINGLLICKKAGSEALTTYYVYDDLKRLRAVLQPQYQEPNANQEEFAFIYDYDLRGRMTSKKLPGAKAVKMVYDNFDRLVLSQDGKQATNGEWAFIKYDIFNRPVVSGVISSNKDQTTWQNDVNAGTAHHENKAPSTTVGYTLNLTVPTVTESQVLNIRYFDDYAFLRPSDLGYTTVYSSSQISNARGYQTGGRTKMLTSQGNWLVSTIYYDSEYRVIQTVRQLNGFTANAYERVSTKYKYNIAPLIQEQTTSQYGISSSAAYTHLKQFQYDHADRLLNVKEKLTLPTTPAKFIDAYTLAHRYNELGQVKEKWQHSTTGLAFRRKTTFTYNIRGWITDGHTEFFAHWQDTEWFPFFRYQLQYQKPSDLSKYSNGNIRIMEWKGKKETAYKKGLLFTYDGVNRLTSAANAGGSTYTYSETETGITYDKNGNIKSLTRGSSLGNIDQLTYTYGSTPSNKLFTISDGSGNTAGVNTGLTGNYLYDDNGNMTRDMARNAVLTYNFLNLPSSVKIGTATAYSYEYDASGVKHKYTADSTYKYEGAFEYNQDNKFKRLAVTDGQIILDGKALVFNYYIKDHLGNTRVVYDQDGKTLQQTDYYPFGFEINRDSASTASPAPTAEQITAARNGTNRYNFLNREIQRGTGYMDLKRRSYDPVTGRFMQVDPVTETQEHLSLYQYGWNNPILRSDPNGDIPDCCGGNPANLVLGQMQNAWNGVVDKVSNFAKEATSGDPIASVNISAGAQLGVTVGSYGFEVNAYSKEIGSLNTNGEIKPGSDAVMKGATINVGFASAEVGKKLEQTEGTTNVKVGNLTLASPTTKTTLEQSGSVGAYGVKVAEHSVTRSVTTGIGGQQLTPVQRNTKTSNLASYSNGGLTPSASGNVGKSAVSVSALIKIDVQINVNKIKSLIGL